MNLNDLLKQVNEIINDDNSTEFEASWNVALHWVTMTSKKKLTKKTIERLAILDLYKDQLHSDIIPPGTPMVTHCLELCLMAISNKSDEDFLEEIAGFTTSEAVCMLRHFSKMCTAQVEGIVHTCKAASHLARFINSAESMDEIIVPDLSDIVSESLKKVSTSNVAIDFSGPSKALDLEESFEEFVPKAYEAFSKAVNAGMMFSEDFQATTTAEISVNVFLAGCFRFIANMAVLPVLSDCIGKEGVLKKYLDCENLLETRDVADMLAELDSATNLWTSEAVHMAFDTVMKLICWDFAVNLGVGVIRDPHPVEKQLIIDVYNKSGMLLHDGDQHSLVHADWSPFIVGFYNCVAQYTTDVGGIHEDVSEVVGKAMARQDINTDRIEGIIECKDIPEEYKATFLKTSPGLAIMKKKPTKKGDDIIDPKPKKARKIKK